MGQMIDISSKITNELPVVKITDDIIVTVNNRKNNVITIQALAKEEERKSKEDGYDEMAFIEKAMGMLVSPKHAKMIEDMDLPLPQYKEVFNTIMSVAAGTYDTPTDK
ncbi:MAG: hypothetical protein ACI4EV_02135 [Lachnospiraceae bacterium]